MYRNFLYLWDGWAPDKILAPTMPVDVGSTKPREKYIKDQKRTAEVVTGGIVSGSIYTQPDTPAVKWYPQNGFLSVPRREDMLPRTFYVYAKRTFGNMIKSKENYFDDAFKARLIIRPSTYYYIPPEPGKKDSPIIVWDWAECNWQMGITQQLHSDSRKKISKMRHPVTLHCTTFITIPAWEDKNPGIFVETSHYVQQSGFLGSLQQYSPSYDLKFTEAVTSVLFIELEPVVEEYEPEPERRECDIIQPNQVRSVIQNKAFLDESFFYNGLTRAYTLVTTELADKGIQADIVREIVLYLAAHYVELEGNNIMEQMPGKEMFSTNLMSDYKADISSTLYGAHAISLDPTGTLSNIGC